jgi:hypothetical protein
MPWLHSPRKVKTDAANRPDRPASAFPVGCITHVALQRQLGILSDRRRRIAADHRDYPDRRRRDMRKSQEFGA